MGKIRKAIIFTTFNEESTIGRLLDSVFEQSEMPDEVVMVDGGSKDGTVEAARAYIKGKKLLKVFVKKGNRSVGRNEAIRRANARIVAITDAGCVLDKDWFKNITSTFNHDNVDVVAGYYKAKARTVFEKCIVPYVFVMPDRVDPESFLPATRSMALRKTVWKKAGGFDEKLSNNEDYAFSTKLKNMGANIKFVQNAFCYWFPSQI